MSPAPSNHPGVRFGEFIRTQRIKLGKTAREVAQAIDMRASNFCNMEHGVINPPSEANKLTKLAEALGLTTAAARRELFDLAGSARSSIPVDIAEIVSSQDAVPILLRTIGNRKLSRQQIEQIVNIVHGKNP